MQSFYHPDPLVSADKGAIAQRHFLAIEGL